MAKPESSLSQKISLVSISSVLIFGSLVCVSSIYKERAYRLASTRSEIIKTASFLVHHSYILLKQKNPANLLHATQVVHQNVSRGNFCFVEIVDANGNLVVPYDPLGLRQIKVHNISIRNAPWNGLAIGQEYMIQDVVYDDVGPVLEGVFGIVEKDRILGYVVLGVSKKPMEDAIKKSLISTLGFLFTLWALAIGITWKWSRNKLQMVGTMEKMARCDSMTGLLNRQTMMEAVQREFAIAERRGTTVYLILADLDHFKMINDTYGHLVGDRVIRSFAKIISSSRRVGEEVGRFGGEEFLILLPDTHLLGAQQVAAKIIEEVQEIELKLDEEDSLKFKVSMGLASYPKDGLSIPEVLHKADRALYMAKSQGRDQFVVWNKNNSNLKFGTTN